MSLTEVSIEEELWNIFSYAALHGNPRDPSKLTGTALLKLCRETMVLDPTMTERAVSQADVHLIFMSELKSPQKNHKVGNVLSPLAKICPLSFLTSFSSGALEYSCGKDGEV